MENRDRLAKQRGYPYPYTWLQTEYWIHGKSLPEIAATVGVTGQCIRNWMREYGIPRRTQGGGKSRFLPKIQALNTTTMTSFEIAAAAGCSPNWVNRLAARHGILYIKMRIRRGLPLQGAKSGRGCIENKKEYTGKG